MLKDPAIMRSSRPSSQWLIRCGSKSSRRAFDAEEQAEALDRLGCDQLQGYLFSKPVPFDDMTALLDQKPEVTRDPKKDPPLDTPRRVAESPQSWKRPIAS